MVKGLIGTPTGSRVVVVAVAPKDGLDQVGVGHRPAVKKDDTLLFVIDVDVKALARRGHDGERRPAGLPTVTLDATACRRSRSRRATRPPTSSCSR